MASTEELELKIKILVERLDQLERARDTTDQFKEAISELKSQILGLAAAYVGLDKIKDFIATGVEVNSQLEATKLGIAGIIQSQTELTDSQGRVLEGQEAFNAATEIASDQLKKLQIDNLETTATFGQLKDAFQAAISPGIEAGLNLDQIRNLTKEIALTAGALGLSTEQIAQETRAILTGDIDINATIAKNLGITREMVKTWTEQGTLAVELSKRMEGFVQMGKATSVSWAGVTSNMQDVYDKLASLTTSGLFEQLKGKINEAFSSLVNPNTGELVEELNGVADLLTELFTDLGTLLGDSIVGLVDGLKQFSSYLNENKGEVIDIKNNFGLVFEQVTQIASGLLDVVKSITTAGTEGKVLSNTFEVIGATLAAFRDGVDFITLAFTKLGAIILEALAYPIEKSGKLLSAFGLEIGNVMQDVADHMKTQADAANASADQLWKNFAEGKTHVAEFNQEVEKLGELIDIPESPGLARVKDEVIELTKSVKENIQSQKDLQDQFNENKITQDEYNAQLAKIQSSYKELERNSTNLRAKLQVMFDAGQISGSEFRIAIENINKSLESNLAVVGKKVNAEADLKKSTEELNTQIERTVKGYRQEEQELDRGVSTKIKVLELEQRLAETKGDTYTASQKTIEIAKEELRESNEKLKLYQREINGIEDLIKKKQELLKQATGEQRTAIKDEIETLQTKVNIVKTQKEITEAQIPLQEKELQNTQQNIAITKADNQGRQESEHIRYDQAAAQEKVNKATSDGNSLTKLMNDGLNYAKESTRALSEATEVLFEKLFWRNRQGEATVGSPALSKYLIQLNSASEKYSELTQKIAEQNQIIDDAERSYRFATNSVGRFLDYLGVAQATAKKAWYEQKLAVDQLQTSFDNMTARTLPQTELALRQINGETDRLKDGFGLLDDEDLSQLRQSIADARDKMLAFRQEVLGARAELAALDEQLLREKGQTDRADVLALENERLRQQGELEAKLAEARALNNKELIAIYEEQLSKLHELYDLKLKNLQKEIETRNAENKSSNSSSNTSSSSSTSKSTSNNGGISTDAINNLAKALTGLTSSSQNINLTVNGILTKEVVSNTLMPFINEHNRLRS